MKITRPQLANYMAIILYGIIALIILLLQFVNVRESCNPESVHSAIRSSLISMCVSSAFFVAFLWCKKTLFKTLFLFICGLILMFMSLGLFSCICGHESYGDYPIFLEFLLILFSALFTILHNRNILLTALYIATLIYLHLMLIS